MSGLNGDVGGAHQATWHEIWRRDSVVVADALNRSPTRLLLDRNFPGRPHLAYFAFDTEPARGPGSIFEDAGKARTAGYTIRQAQLEEKTGYTLIPYEAPTAAIGGSVLNSRDPEAEAEAELPRKPVAKPLQNARTAEDGKTPAETEPPPQIASDAVLEEMASAMRESLAEAMARAAAGEADGNLKLETGNLETKPDKEDA